MKINLIVAVDSKGGISKNGEIPWDIKEDMNFFQDVTKRNYTQNGTAQKNVLIMGKNTWKKLPETARGLKDRITIIVSSTMYEKELYTDNTTKSEVYLSQSLTSAIEMCQGWSNHCGKVFICGGGGIYKEAVKNLVMNEVYLTRIDKDYNCDNIIEGLDDTNLSFYTFDLYSSKTFQVTDRNNGEQVRVTFKKFYKEKPVNKNPEEQQYLDLLENILNIGHFRQTRNAKTWSTFGKHLEFDLSKGFPILTTKKVFLRGVFEELIFFLKGDTNSKHLSEKGVKIWEGNTSREFLDSMGLNHYQDGDMGPMYGYQLKHFNAPYFGYDKDYTGQGVDQVEYCLYLLKTDPYSRRILMTTYNPAQAKEGVLFPCHGITIMFHVDEAFRLSCMMLQRSSDTFLGLNFNLTSYSLLIHLFCEVLNNDSSYTGPKFSPGRLIMNLGDTHIYEDHKEQCIRQILREPYEFPQLIFKRKVTDLTDFKFEDLELVNYNCYPNIPAKMSA